MNDEVKRFFDSLNFKSDEFNEKVILNKAKESFEVIIKLPKVVNKSEVNKLFTSAKNGINGEKICHITLKYDEVTIEDLKKYLDIFLEELIKERPSFSPLKDYELTLENDTLELTIYSKVVKSELNKELKRYLNTLKEYGLGT